MSKKKTLFFAGLTLACGIFCMSFIVIDSFSAPAAAGERKSAAETGSAQQRTADVFIVKEYDGRVAVFTAGSLSPDKVYDTHVSQLPEYDRNLLIDGILANNKEELRKIIEDYTS